MLLGQPTSRANSRSSKGQKRSRWQVVQRASFDGSRSSSTGPPTGKLPARPTKEASVAFDSTALPQNFCIIEDKGTVQDFAKLQLQEIKEAVQVRRNRIFLLMEEIRRLRIHQRVKGGEAVEDAAGPDSEELTSAVPWFPKLTEKNLSRYYTAYFGVVAALIVFGGFVAPVLEVKMGLGGASYTEFIEGLHLPSQLAQVDPIVASFIGGAVGAISALLVVEVKNIQTQQADRCLYCTGTGYLECGGCSGSGCSDCSMAGKVMCTSCLCTGKSMATEHDIRADPFD